MYPDYARCDEELPSRCYRHLQHKVYREALALVRTLTGAGRSEEMIADEINDFIAKVREDLTRELDGFEERWYAAEWMGLPDPPTPYDPADLAS